MYTEFFTQVYFWPKSDMTKITLTLSKGDLEKAMGNKPVESMDRERACIPSLQVTLSILLGNPLTHPIISALPACPGSQVLLYQVHTSTPGTTIISENKIQRNQNVSRRILWHFAKPLFDVWCNIYLHPSCHPSSDLSNGAISTPFLNINIFTLSNRCLLHLCNM